MKQKFFAKRVLLWLSLFFFVLARAQTPTIVGASNITSTSATVNWVQQTGTTYTLSVYTNSAYTTIFANYSGLTAGSKDLTGLTQGQVYYYQVSTGTGIAATGYFTAQNSYTPMDVTGFTADVIANGTGAPANSTTTTVDSGSDVYTSADFQSNTSIAVNSSGLPASRNITNNTAGQNFFLQNYAANNSLRITGNGNSGTLTLSKPVAMTNLYIANAAGGTNVTYTAEIQFTNPDNNQTYTQTVTGITAYNWDSSVTTDVVKSGIPYILRSSTNTTPSTGRKIYASTINIDADKQNYLVTGVKFTQTASSSSTAVLNIFAISAKVATPVCTAPDAPVATAPSNVSVCYGNAVAAITLSGTPSNVTFDISGGAAIGLPNQTGITSIPAFTPTAAGTATITITPKAYDCTGVSVTFTITVNNTAAPTASAQTYCNGTTVASLSATGSYLQWYTASTGGSALAATTALATGTYYVSQTLNNCESTRTAVAVTINTTAAPTASAQTYCNGKTVASLTATGTTLKWYTALTGGSDLASTTVLATGTYYVSQTLNSCESTRTAVAVTINTTAVPTASAQSFYNGATVASLVATGTGLQWYAASTGGTSLAPATVLATGTYYVSQTVNGCESTRTSVTITITTIRYVKPTASGTGDGTSWANASANLQNMINTTGVQQVWVAAGTYYPTGNGYTMKNNMAIYGGFAGTETALSQRNWVTNVTTLNGNNERSVIYNDFTTTTALTATSMLDGFTITGGYNSNLGGGIYNHYASPTLTNLTITGNTGTNGGGVCNMYSSSPSLTNINISGNTATSGGGVCNYYSSSPTLTNVTISGNTATSFGSGIYNNTSCSPVITNVIISGNTTSNYGGTMYNSSNSSPTLINVTISGNTSYAMTNNGVGSSNGTVVLRNTLVYGNQSGILDYSNTGYPVTRYNSLVQGLTDTSNGNITGTTNPMFVNAPAYTTAPFTGGDYSLSSCSPVINAGNNDYITSGITTDIAGNARIYNTTVDMGPYELQQEPSTPAAPTASAQTYCNGATVASLTATGSNLQWYTASTGGSELATTTALTTGTYYVSQTINGCVSARTAVAVTINTTAAPTASAQTYCNGATVASLTATGTTLKWYTALTGGSELATTTALATGTYYVSQTLNSCESMRTAVAVTINTTAAPTASAQTFCGSGTVANLTATGTSLQWYTASTGGTVLATTTALATGTYYVSQTLNGCVSTRKAVAVTVNITAAPTASAQTYCSGTTVASLTATGTTLKWYTASTGGSSLATTTALATGTYYVSQTLNSCESTRTAVAVTINTTAAPTASAQSFCGSGTVANLTATGTTLQWYAASTGGSALATTTALATGTYYVSQTLNGCVSARTAVAVTVNITAAPTASAQTFCNGTTVASLTATGTTLKWYAASTGGSVLATTTALATGTYYVSQTLNSCESTRTAVAVTINTTAAPTASAQTFCSGTTVASLTATGSSLQWYAVSTGGSVLDTTTALATGTYYVSQTVNGCESTRTAVAVTINTTAAPTASAQAFCNGTTVASLTAIGSNLQWYTASTGGSALATTTALATGTYYVSQTLNGCESTRTAVAITLTSKTWTGATNNDWNTGSNWCGNTLPVATDDVTIAPTANNPVISTGLAHAHNLTVGQGATLTVAAGATLSVENILSVHPEGTLTISNNGALLQAATATANTNVGKITIHKNSNPLYRLDYTMWSSPVDGQNLALFSPATSTNRFYEYKYDLNSSNEWIEGYWPVTPGTTNFAAAKGYLIRMPNSISTLTGYAEGTASSVLDGTFTGTPNNGTVNIDLSILHNRYTAVGNPYPSPISVSDFFAANSTKLYSATGLYLWRKRNNSASSSYATLTQAGYVANPDDATTSAANIGSFYQGAASTWMISQGQGFIVRTVGDNFTTAPQLTFTNSMRRAAQGTNQGFFKSAQSTDSKLWLNLTAESGSASQAMVAYMEAEGTLGLDYGYDGLKLTDGNTVALYSLAESTPLAIQARPGFNAGDVVPMGFAAPAAGQYTISLDHTEGVFSQGQAIYLRDNAEGIIRNMGTNDYSFTTEAGTFEGRFDVIYTTTALGTDNPVIDPNTVVVYKQGNTININTGTAMMNGVTIFDIRGRQLYNAGGINATETAVSNLNIAQQVIIVEIDTVKGKVTKRIVF